MAHIEGTTTAGSTGPVNTSQGWGVAGFIVALAIACALGAWWYNTQTFHEPTDPTWVQEADRRGGAGGGHGAQKAGH